MCDGDNIVDAEAFKNTSIWKSSLGISTSPHVNDVERLRSAYNLFRTRAAAVTSRISAAFPTLTIHDVTHLDALWETGDLIAGAGYPLNPIEGFVFGGAILLHDSAQCFEAYEGGVEGLRQCVQWKDAFTVAQQRHPSEDVEALNAEADFVTVRHLHAKQASLLAVKAWPSDAGEIYLIEDYELRKCYGALIGQIAESHNWSIERVASELSSQVNAPGTLPREWWVDPVKIACLLRCADASHIDNRRAPDFLRALIKQRGLSENHWKAQNWLSRADIDRSDPDERSIVITSNHSFGVSDADAWWVAFDAVNLIDREIKSSNALLASRPQANNSPPFKIGQISGASSPEITSRYIVPKDWKPCNAHIHVGNVERLVSTLGGSMLYGGERLPIALRELIQNARDAVAARRKIAPPEFVGKIRIRVRNESESQFIDIIDNGIGMSERVLTGPFLDFGNSFWISDLVTAEWPGLRSSGFEPVGRFGIGFYSVFMIANQVTVQSRRYDAGLHEFQKLDFPNGLTLRPILSRTHSNGQEYSTIVSCSLKKPLNEPIKVSSGFMGVDDVAVKIEDVVAAIVAGLDVKVEFQKDDPTEWLPIHDPISSLNTHEKRRIWLERISFSKLPRLRRRAGYSIQSSPTERDKRE